MTARSLGKRIGLGKTAEIYDYGDGVVVKLFFPDMPESFAEAELRVGRVVADAGLPVPSVLDLVEIDGRFGVVCERLVGESMLDVIQKRPWRLPVLARLLADLHFEIHRIEAPELGSQAERLRERIGHAPGLSDDSRRLVEAELGRRGGEEISLCHGDFHPDNVLLTAEGPKIIDWLTATRGSPAADVARSALMLQISRPERPQSRLATLLTTLGRRALLRVYLDRYLDRAGLAREDIAVWDPIISAGRLDEGIERETVELQRRVEVLTAA